MNTQQRFDKLNWLTEKKIGRIFTWVFFGWHINIHVAKYKDGYWKR